MTRPRIASAVLSQLFLELSRIPGGILEGTVAPVPRGGFAAAAVALACA